VSTTRMSSGIGAAALFVIPGKAGIHGNRGVVT
jgi:hypothetical protein